MRSFRSPSVAVLGIALVLLAGLLDPGLSFGLGELPLVWAPFQPEAKAAEPLISPLVVERTTALLSALAPRAPPSLG